MKASTRLLTALLGAGLVYVRPTEVSAQIVDQQTTGAGQYLSAEEIQNLPVNGRTFEGLINNTPGVLTDRLPSQTAQLSAGGSNYMIDGVAITDPLPSGSDPTSVDLDAIQEIDVVKGGYEAEYGGATGGVINIVTKSGTNEFQSGTGAAFKFFLEEGAAGTCLKGAELPGGGSTRGRVQFDVPLEIPKNFFRGQWLGSGGSIQVPPCPDTDSPNIFFRGNFPQPGTPTHFMLTSRGRFGVNLDAALGLDNPASQALEHLRDKSFALTWGPSIAAAPGSLWVAKASVNYQARPEVEQGGIGPVGDKIFIRYDYFNQPSACPQVTRQVLGFEKTFLSGSPFGLVVPLEPAPLDSYQCQKVGQVLQNAAAGLGDPAVALGGTSGTGGRENFSWGLVFNPRSDAVGETGGDPGKDDEGPAFGDDFGYNFSERFNFTPIREVTDADPLSDVQGAGLEIVETGPDDPRDTPVGEDPRDTPVGDDPRDAPLADNVCGPDVTAAYVEALKRAFERLQQLPDGEKGALDGAKFMYANGTNIDLVPDDIDLPEGGDRCPRGICKQYGNIKNASFTLAGHCLPGHMANNILYGFEAYLLEMPWPVAVAGAQAHETVSYGNAWESATSIAAYTLGWGLASAMSAGKSIRGRPQESAGVDPLDLPEEARGCPHVRYRRKEHPRVGRERRLVRAPVRTVPGTVYE